MNIPLNPNHIRIIACLSLLAGSASCEQNTNPSLPAASNKQSREIMGTFAEVTAFAADKRTAKRAVKAGYLRLEEINSKMSGYLPDSEVSTINALAADEALKVSADTMLVMAASKEYAQASGGVFDVTCKPLVSLWKQAGQSGRLPTEEAIASARKQVGWSKVILDKDNAAVSLSESGIHIDLGAIAKGYGLDVAAEAMKETGATSGLVNVGGDVVAFGSHGDTGQPWIVGIRHPFDSDAIYGKLAVVDRAVATSGNQQRFSMIDGKRYSHIVDPRTGMPAEEAPSVTVIATTGMAADAWATIFSVLTVNEGKQLAKTIDGLEVLWLWGTADEIKSEQTPGFDQFVTD